MGDFASNRHLWALAEEHPQTQAMLRAAAEMTVQPPFEETEGFRLECAKVWALLADVPVPIRKALTQARARLVETEAALATAETERSRVQVARTLDSSGLDKWARDTATAGQRTQALEAAHAQATQDVEQATRAVLVAMMDIAERRHVKLVVETDKARAAIREAQAVLAAAYADMRAVEALGVRLRDEGASDRYVKFVLENGYADL